MNERGGGKRSKIAFIQCGFSDSFFTGSGVQVYIYVLDT